MLSETTIHDILSRVSREVCVRFCVDCAARALGVVHTTPERDALGRQVLECCELWLARPGEGLETPCIGATGLLDEVLGEWARDPQSEHRDSAVYFALQACQWAGMCVTAEVPAACADQAANRARVAWMARLEGTAERFEALRIEDVYQSSLLASLLWPELSSDLADLAVMLVEETACSVDEAETLVAAMVRPAGLSS
jgi:hypothetical protein